MSHENDSDVVAPRGVNGSSEHGALLPNEGDPSLAAAIHSLVRQIGETNIQLILLADQTAKCLAHVSILLDLVLSDDDDDDTPSTYLDGTPIL